MKQLSFLVLLAFLFTFATAQGPNRTFCKYKKQKNETLTPCAENCATIMLIYEKGTFLNAIEGAIGIDTDIVLAAEKNTYCEYAVSPGKHEIMMTHGVLQGQLYYSYMDTLRKEDKPDYIFLTTKTSSIGEFEIMLNASIENLKFNQLLQPCNSKMFPHQVFYFTFTREFEAGHTYYFKTIKLPEGISLACGPIITETTKEDFDRILKDCTVKEKADPIIYHQMKE